MMSIDETLWSNEHAFAHPVMIEMNLMYIILTSYWKTSMNKFLGKFLVNEIYLFIIIILMIVYSQTLFL
jgi:hypothetical protein